MPKLAESIRLPALLAAQHRTEDVGDAATRCMVASERAEQRIRTLRLAGVVAHGTEDHRQCGRDCPGGLRLAGAELLADLLQGRA